MMNDKLYREVEESLSEEKTGRKKRPGVRVWQNKQKKSGSQFDPFAVLVFLYVIFSVSCLLWFGWKYYALKHEVARLSEIIATLYEEKAAEPLLESSDQKESVNNPLPGGQTEPGRVDTSADSSLPARSVMYTVKAGDSWWTISENHYGVGDYYKKLAAYNKMNNQPPYKGLVVELPPVEVLGTFQ